MLYNVVYYLKCNITNELTELFVSFTAVHQRTKDDGWQFTSLSSWLVGLGVVQIKVTEVTDLFGV